MENYFIYTPFRIYCYFSTFYMKLVHTVHARIQKISSGGVQIPRRGLTENFNMAKTNNLAIPAGVRTPCPPPSGSAHAVHNKLYSEAF